MVQPLDLHLVNVDSIPTGPTHGDGRLQPHPGDVLKSTPNVRTSPRSGLNLEGRLSDPLVFLSKSYLLLSSHWQLDTLRIRSGPDVAIAAALRH